MTTFARKPALQRTILALAILAVFDPALAQTADAKAEAKGDAKAASTVQTEGSATAGLGLVSGSSGDRALFGQYNGLRNQNAVGLFDFDYARRDDASGAAMQAYGTNLGLQTRELGFSWRKPGDWKFTADYGELLRVDPYTVNTGMVGAGTTTPQVVRLNGGPGTGSDTDLSTKRKGLGLGFSKWLSPAFDVEASVNSENKNGSQIWGRGMNCPSNTAPGCLGTTASATGAAILFLPQPIDYNHTQVNARVNYGGDKLRMSAGYYGSFFSNANGTLNPSVPGVLNNQIGTPLPLASGLQPILQQAMALAPDNQANYFDVTGNYTFSPTTRGNFKLQYGWASQNQDFASAGLTGAPAGVSNLGGKFNETLMKLGLSSSPVRDLTLLADLKYSDRNDKTPIASYNVEGQPPQTWTNRSLPNTTWFGRLGASYRFLKDYTATAGLDYTSIDRGTFTPTAAAHGVSALRQSTDEIGWQLALRKRMTDTFSGWIEYRGSQRDGSNWLRANSGTGVTEVTDPATQMPATAIYMPSLANRNRDTLKLLGSWEAMEGLSVQFSAQGGWDRYSLPSSYSLQRTDMNLFSVDATWAVSEAWNVNAYVSYGNQTLNQTRPNGYILAYDNTTTNLGVGFNGKPMDKVELGGTLSLLNDRNAYKQTLQPTASPAAFTLLAATGGLPDVSFKQTILKLWGKYAMSQASTLRLDLVYYHANYNDWGYGYAGVPFTYSDNTTLSMQQSQSVGYAGISYIYAFK